MLVFLAVEKVSHRRQSSVRIALLNEIHNLNGRPVMTRNTFLEATGICRKFVFPAPSGLCVAIVLLSLAILSGCNTTSVYLDKFAPPPGSAPPQPQVGTSTISGDVVVAADPTNTNASDHWLQLTRPAPTTTASYVGT